MFSWLSPRNTEGIGKQNFLFSSGPVIKYLMNNFTIMHTKFHKQFAQKYKLFCHVRPLDIPKNTIARKRLHHITVELDAVPST